jgi:XTP/dITP diphosphohydrolase
MTEVAVHERPEPHNHSGPGVSRFALGTKGMMRRHRQIRGRLVIATHNPGKLAEMRGLLAPYGIDAVSAAELGLPEPSETGATFADNARIKARAAAPAAGLPAFADDSGLVVDALDGAPGIHSARWAGSSRDFARAMQRVEEALRARGANLPAQRRAHFVSALCVAWPDGHVEEFEGRVDGTLVWPPRGKHGFGYDPMFQPDSFALTFGEMTAEEKHGLPPRGRGLSHRARAFRELAEACLG